MGEKEKKAGKEKKQTGKTMNPPEESDISPEEAAGTAAGIMAGAMAGPAAKVMVKAAATGAMKKTPAKAKKTAPKKAEKKAGREQTEKKKAQEAAAEAISKVLGALPIVNIAATTPAFNDMLETVLRNMGEGLKTGASVTTELDKLWMEHLEITDRSEDGYDFWTNLAVLSMKSRTEELLSNSKIVLGAGKKLADVGAETIDIARDLYKIGAACKAYLEGKYDHFLDDLWKGLEEACEELGMVFSHPKEALEAKLKEQKEAIANSTPEDHGYLAMGIVLDFLGPAAIKKAGRVVKLAAKHIKAPGSFDLTKPTNGSIVEDAFSNMVSEALDGDGQEDEDKTPNINKIINSATQPKKGGETIAGHALQKHAGRNPDIWGKVSGNAENINNSAMKHINDILNGPGNFKIIQSNGHSFYEKMLPDGRGIRVNMDSTFKGFIDQIR